MKNAKRHSRPVQSRLSKSPEKGAGEPLTTEVQKNGSQGRPSPLIKPRRQETAAPLLEDISQYPRFRFESHHDSLQGGVWADIACDGEHIKAVRFAIGRHHRGMEKIAESRGYPDFVPVIERLGGSGALFASWAYIVAMESLLNIAVAHRAEYLRLIVAEIGRLSSHLLYLGRLASNLTAEGPLRSALKLTEPLWQWLDRLTGRRHVLNFIQPGGVSRDSPKNLLQDLAIFLDEFEFDLRDFFQQVVANPLLRHRLSGLARVSPELAQEYALSGPNLRASGISLDLRWDRPFSVYAELDLARPPLPLDKASGGDAWARVLQRWQDIALSLQLLRQAIRQIPTGRTTLPPASFTPPVGEVYVALEAPAGELGCYLVSNGTAQPARLKIQSPSCASFALIARIAPGHEIGAFPLILGSFDVDASEFDR